MLSTNFGKTSETKVQQLRETSWLMLSRTHVRASRSLRRTDVQWGRDVSKHTRGAGTIVDGIEKAKSIATGGATNAAQPASNKVHTYTHT
jgi:hypothetical protein